MLVFKNAYLIDGTGGEPVDGTTVIVAGSKIQEVGKDLPIPAEAQVIDLKGAVLLPGFSDAHTHFGGSALLERAPYLGNRFATFDYAQNAASYLEWGVTTVRSGGDFTPDIVTFRNEVNEGKIRSPRILTPGKGFMAKDGYPGYLLYGSEEVNQGAFISISDDTDIEAEVKGLVDLGVDLIKVFLQNVNPLANRAPCPGLTSQQVKEIADAAHKYGKKVMAHTDDVRFMEEAVNAGADTIEHILQSGDADYPLTDEFIQVLLDKGVWIVPTMFTTKVNHPSYPVVEAIMGRLVKSGVKIGVGCDTGAPFIPYGESFHSEMELLVGVGMTPMQVLTAATGGNAEMFGKSDEFGTVQPGKAADLVVLGSNPLEDIKNTRDIKLVLREGRIVVDKFLSE